VCSACVRVCMRGVCMWVGLCACLHVRRTRDGWCDGHECASTAALLTHLDALLHVRSEDSAAFSDVADCMETALHAWLTAMYERAGALPPSIRAVAEPIAAVAAAVRSHVMLAGDAEEPAAQVRCTHCPFRLVGIWLFAHRWPFGCAAVSILRIDCSHHCEESDSSCMRLYGVCRLLLRYCTCVCVLHARAYSYCCECACVGVGWARVCVGRAE
jgi:hypothetical protein